MFNTLQKIILILQERFTSPWAREQEDEEKFWDTIRAVGSLLKDDLQLQAMYHMLVMMTPAKNFTPKYVQVMINL